jgi:hypothetical protein
MCHSIIIDGKKYAKIEDYCLCYYKWPEIMAFIGEVITIARDPFNYVVSSGGSPVDETG